MRVLGRVQLGLSADSRMLYVPGRRSNGLHRPRPCPAGQVMIAAAVSRRRILGLAMSAGGPVQQQLNRGIRRQHAAKPDRPVLRDPRDHARPRLGLRRTATPRTGSDHSWGHAPWPLTSSVSAMWEGRPRPVSALRRGRMVRPVGVATGTRSGTLRGGPGGSAQRAPHGGGLAGRRRCGGDLTGRDRVARPGRP